LPPEDFDILWHRPGYIAKQRNEPGQRDSYNPKEWMPPDGGAVGDCRVGLTLRWIGGLPGRALKEGIAAGLSEQRFDLSPEFPVVAAGMIEEGSPLTGIPLESRMIDSFHPFPSFGIHLLASLALPLW
jgi:hypothetical protein